MRPAGTIGYEIKMLSNEIKRCMDESILQSGLDGLTGMQGMILGFLYYREQEGQEVFQRDVEREFNIRRSTASGLLRLLERDGYLTRVPVSQDARLKKLCLTSKAVEAQTLIEQKIHEMDLRLSQGLSEEEQETFYRLIHKIRGNLSGPVA